MLYVLVGLCWLPVVFIQMRMRDLAAAAARDGAPLPSFITDTSGFGSGSGWPAFLGVIAIFVLMIWKPQ